MTAIWAWASAPEIGVLVGFHVFILLMLALDLGVFQRQAHAVSMTEAAVWSTIWVALALVFAVGIWQFWHLWRPEEADRGGDRAVEFITGYLVEKSLSVDNLFVFLVIFRYFAVPAHLQQRVLLWGIIGAIVMRAALILIGAALLSAFHWMIYVFAAVLLYTSFKMLRSVEEEIDPGRNPLLRLAQRFLPVVSSYESQRFWVRREGRWHATPLPLVLLVVESTDVMFALDSIPAIFGLTKDAFIVYTSNIFAILGLRALYFLLANFLGMFRYLNVGLALVLGFVGLKMIVEQPLEPYLASRGIEKGNLILISLGVIATILTVSVVASIVAGPKEPLEHLPEGVAETPPADPNDEEVPAREP
ncbi:MAG TPA: TerC family protein [Gemmataceae bacterium]|nr:TerC family protein [Gemmataceae bacterium]